MTTTDTLTEGTLDETAPASNTCSCGCCAAPATTVEAPEAAVTTSTCSCGSGDMAGCGPDCGCGSAT